MKSLMLRVLITASAASLASFILKLAMEDDVSIIKIIFFAPDVAVVYQGLYLGSYSIHYPVSSSVFLSVG